MTPREQEFFEKAKQSGASWDEPKKLGGKWALLCIPAIAIVLLLITSKSENKSPQIEGSNIALSSSPHIAENSPPAPLPINTPKPTSEVSNRLTLSEIDLAHPINQANYEKVEVGTDYFTVRSIFGAGTQISEQGSGMGKLIHNQYRVENACIDLMFLDNKLTSKSLVGHLPSGIISRTISAADFLKNSRDGGIKQFIELVRTGDSDSINALLSVSPELSNAKGPLGETPLSVAVIGDRVEIIQRLIKCGAAVNALSKDNDTPLHTAMSFLSHYRAEKVKILLSAGADVNARGRQGQSPLHLAVDNGDLASVILLVEAGANANALDDEGKSPLHIAMRQNKSMIELLLANGANVNIGDKHGDTPLMIAFKQPALERLLLEHGADANAKSHYGGQTLLHAEAEAGDTESVKVLLEFGADANIRDSKGKTAADLATKNGFSSVSVLLENSKAP